MRVLVLSSVFPNRIKPMFGVFVKERVRHIAEHCEVVVVAPVPWFPLNRWIRGYKGVDLPDVDRCEGLRVYHPRFLCIPLIGKCFDGVLYFLSLLWPIMRLRKSFRFDLIDTHFSYPDGVGGALLGKLLRTPVFITLRGTHDIRHAQSRLRRVQIIAALKSAETVICVSESLRRFGERIGIPRARLEVIANGIDQSLFFPANREAARKKLGLPEDATIVLAVGAMIEGKGHHRVIEILPELIASHPKLIFVALGDQGVDRSYHRHVEKFIEVHGLQEHVLLVPAQPHDEIPCWMNSADLFCLATRSEGRCNAILEALACGIPVVTTEVGGNGELIRDDLNGFLVPFWNKDSFQAALERALSKEWDCVAISEQARANTWNETAEHVVRQFRSIANSNSSPRMSMYS